MRNPFALALGLMSFMGASTALAVNMAPGDFVSPLPGTTSALEPQLAGTVVEDVIRTVTGTFTTTNEPYEVKVQDRVILADDGTYDFYYRLTLVEKPDVYPLTVSRRGFAGFTTNVGWRSDGEGTLNPTSGTRTLDGNTILWDFGFNMPEGGVTRSIFVDTQATQYGLVGEGVVDLSPSFNVNGRSTFVSFAPVVPEPASIAASALVAVLMRRARRA